MRRSLALLLPLLLAMTSCGTSARYAQQRFQDGIYARGLEAAAYQPLTEEDFEALAAERIARKQLDSLNLAHGLFSDGSENYTVVYVDYPWVYGPWMRSRYMGSFWARSPFYHGWYWDD